MDDTSFRVIAKTNFVEVMVVFIFSSGTGRWSFGTSVSWNALSIHYSMLSWSSNYVHGCFYWKFFYMNKLLKFNMSSMEFSTVDLPPERGHIIIVEAGECRLVIFGRVDNCTSLCYTIRQIGDERFDQLKMDIIIPLPAGYTYFINGPSEGYIFILGHPVTGTTEIVCFSLEIKTLKIERVCHMSFVCCHVCLYLGFPPSMSQRRI